MRIYNTIAGFALRYAISFPNTSGGILEGFGNQNWPDVYRGGTEIVRSHFGKKIIKASYTGLFVDEYQDCTVAQHELILAIASVIPCRVLGDPLQGIFEFGIDSPLVEWENHVFSNFERLPDLTHPWRWQKVNPVLGLWLADVRIALESKHCIDLSTAPRSVRWFSNTPENQRRSCFDAARKDGTTIAIHKWPHEAHSLARLLGGAFVSMEEVECRDLLKWADTLEQDRASATLCFHIIDFASECLTTVSTALATIRRKVERGDFNTTRIKNNAEILERFGQLCKVKDWHNLLAVLELIQSIPGAIIFRPELWHDMKKALREHASAADDKLREIAWKIRDVGRFLGRDLRKRCVSRTLLVKGLEFQHCIILNAQSLTTKELYVAMTRGSTSLVVLSNGPILNHAVAT